MSETNETSRDDTVTSHSYAQPRFTGGGSDLKPSTLTRELRATHKDRAEILRKYKSIQARYGELIRETHQLEQVREAAEALVTGDVPALALADNGFRAALLRLADALAAADYLGRRKSNLASEGLA